MKYIRNILNSRSKNDGNFFLQLKKILGFKTKDVTLYKKAFTHRSMNIRDKEGVAINYERLEFVGDAMLGAVIASYLFSEVPHGDEGYLTKMRSKVVSREHLNELGKELNFIDLVEFAPGKTLHVEIVHADGTKDKIKLNHLDLWFGICFCIYLLFHELWGHSRCEIQFYATNSKTHDINKVRCNPTTFIS